MHANRLIKEKSPYLLQHAYNPVDWYAWGPAAFEKSRAEDKPILLSIGYSTCHWCHVMEEESFEDTRTAEIMNRSFVPVKVDREERPDIDSVYMSYVMATTGSGGWPMTVFLTPERKPFYGGTYFPPEDRYGMPGFKTLLSSIAEAWTARRSEISESADSAVSFLQGKRNLGGGSTVSILSEETLYTAFERFKSGFDSERGGFGRAPKFPRSHALSLLLRYWQRSGNGEALAMVEKTLSAMAAGGMYDQLGGGFHRYSTDAEWRVPHFEKMLYDQALLVLTYLEAYQATHKAEYARVARETLDTVLREMTSPDGGFFSAQDADSEDPFVPGKKREGAYFVWKKEEIAKFVSAEEADAVYAYYGVQENGNAISDPHQEFVNQNVLHVAKSVDAAAEKLLSSARAKLLAARAHRRAPHLDDKILTDWNGLMIAAFAAAAPVLEEPRYEAAAVRAAEFILKKLKIQNGKLLHRYRDGEAAIEGSLNDYAFMIVGWLRLYEVTFSARWLKEATQAADAMIRLFGDPDGKGFFLTSSEGEMLITRPKEVYDGAVPSGNSMAALGLFLLNRFTGELRFQKAAEAVLETFSAEIAAEPTAYPQMLMALDFALGPSREIMLAGDLQDASMRVFLKEIHLRFMPNKIIMLHGNGEQAAIDGKATVYVCRNHACELPVTDVRELRRLLA